MTPPVGIADQTIAGPSELRAAWSDAPPQAESPTATARAVMWPATKRAMDLVLASLFLLLTVPLLAVVALAVKLDSPGPVFHRVSRMGYGGRPFLMLKFRKMHTDAQGLPLTGAADPRLTRVGALLTRTRLDELPQLWHVLRGEMSLIGPRPEDPRFVELQAGAYQTILSVRPGITGITQLAFADERNILDAGDPVSDYVQRIQPGKIRLDLLYARRSHVAMDLSVIYWTLRAVLTGVPVAVCRRTGRMNVRRRPKPGFSLRDTSPAR